MKDKLVKTGKSKRHYRLMRFFKGAGFSLLALLVFATPVLVMVEMNAIETRAEETVQVESTPEETSSESN